MLILTFWWNYHHWSIMDRLSIPNWPRSLGHTGGRTETSVGASCVAVAILRGPGTDITPWTSSKINSFSLIFIDFHEFSLFFIDFHWFSLFFVDFHWFHGFWNYSWSGSSESEVHTTRQRCLMSQHLSRNIPSVAWDLQVGWGSIIYPLLIRNSIFIEISPETYTLYILKKDKTMYKNRPFQWYTF